MKKLYLRLAGRERWLLALFLWLAAGLWLWGVTARGLRLQQRYDRHRQETAAQQLWIDRRPKIETLARQAAARLQAERTFDALRLFAEVNRLAGGLSFEVGGQRSEQSGRIAIHQVQLSLSKVGMAEFLAFYAEVQKREPYLGIEECEIDTDRGTAGRLNVRLRIYAIEILRDTAELKI